MSTQKTLMILAGSQQQQKSLESTKIWKEILGIEPYYQRLSNMHWGKDIVIF